MILPPAELAIDETSFEISSRKSRLPVAVSAFAAFEGKAFFSSGSDQGVDIFYRRTLLVRLVHVSDVSGGDIHHQ